MGDEKISRREYEKILEAGFSDARIGLTPPSLDEVHAGDLQRTRLGSIRVLFFLGLNDGWVPAVQGAPGFLSSIERELLEKEGFELSPGERENSYLQRFYLYLALARPSEKLFLSFCRSGSDGKGKRPSYAAGLLSRMLCLPVKDGDVRDTLQGAATLRTGTSWLAAKLCDMSETHGEEDKELQELLRLAVEGQIKGSTLIQHSRFGGHLCSHRRDPVMIRMVAVLQPTIPRGGK